VIPAVFSRRCVRAVCLVGPLVGPVAACNQSGNFGENITVRAGVYQQVTGPLDGHWSLHLPVDRGYNVTDAQRSSKGAAQAESSADQKGAATCLADATAGGSAEAAFQVGHVLTYDAAEPLDVRVTFDVTYECEAANVETAGDVEPLGLKAYVMDSNRRVLGRVFLAQADPERLPSTWTGRESPSFVITLHPRTGYHLIVAGKVEAAGPEGPGSRSAVHVRSFALAIEPVGG